MTDYLLFLEFKDTRGNVKCLRGVAGEKLHLIKTFTLPLWPSPASKSCRVYIFGELFGS